jgi:cytoskeletal protein CcmA (bactofilin family)
MFHRPTTSNPQSASSQGEQDAMTQQPQSPESSETQDRSVDIPASSQSSPFQRPQTAAPIAPAARMPGSYAAYPAYGGIANPLGASDAKGRHLVIGQGITMSGEIESCDHLTVEGTVEAALKGASVLEITENGMFYGTVEINEATIAGKFEGDLTVNGRLTVRSTGAITGAIAYKELAVEAGATIDGKITPLSGGKESSSGKKSHKGKSEDSPKAASSAASQQDDLPILRAAAQ